MVVSFQKERTMEHQSQIQVRAPWSRGAGSLPGQEVIAHSFSLAEETLGEEASNDLHSGQEIGS